MIRLAATWVLIVLLFRTMAFAGKNEEALLGEKSIKEEAFARPCDDLFRVIIIPERTLGFVFKFYLNRPSAVHPASGHVTFKAPIPSIGFDSRARDLRPEEIDQVWDIIYGEELFTLPAKQKLVPVVPGPNRRYVRVEGPNTVIFSHYEMRTHRSEEVVRSRWASHPADRAAAALVKLVADLVAEIEKAEAAKGRQ